MSNTDTSELLKLCDEVIYATQPGEYTAMTNGEMAKVCEDAAPHLARALKSRLQAEAPTDAEVATIEKRHADCEGFYAGHGGYRPDWHKDRTILLAKLRTTSQAEAQAPTTAAQASVLTRDDWAKIIYAEQLQGASAPTINDSIYWSKEDTYDAPPTTTETNSNE